MDSKCIGFFGKIFGHNFKSIYNEEESEGRFPDNFWTPSLAAFSEEVSRVINSTKSRKSTYVHDICSRCGKIIEIQKRN